MKLIDRTDAWVLWVLRDGVWWLVGWGTAANVAEVALQRQYRPGEWKATKGING
jgi:hypothetical protein